MNWEMQAFKILALSLLLAPRIAVGGAGQNPSDLQDVVDSERNFARTALEHGIRASFLQFFADDCIILAPGPTNGKAFYNKLEERGRRLIWRPIFATIARSGDLGVTTGPWELKKSATNETSLGFGDFVSIWKKQADNSWKVALDVGIEHARPIDVSPEIELSLANPETARDLAKSLEQEEKIFHDNLMGDTKAALFAAASPGVRIFRNDCFPAVGREAASKILSSNADKEKREVTGGAMSAATDLAYRYGSYSGSHAGVEDSGYFVTIWQIDRNSEWKIILDLQQKSPPPKE